MILGDIDQEQKGFILANKDQENRPPACRIVNWLEDDRWEKFVGQHPQGNIFHTREMYEVFARGKGHNPMFWAAVRPDGQVLALFLPVKITLNSLAWRFTTRAIVYGSVLCDPSSEGRQALSELLRAYQKTAKGSILFTELRNLDDLGELQSILEMNRFEYQPHLNYLIDLNRSPEAVFSGIGARTRKNIRHGLNRGEVTIKEVKERDQVDTCYGLLCKTYHAAQVPLASCSLFEAAFDRLFPKGMVRFTLAYVGEEPAATSVELLYKDVMYGWYGGMDRAYSKYVPNELLMWHILKWGAENGYRVYDFGGAGKPDEEYGVRDFKAKFGGELVCYGRNIYIHTPGLLKVSERCYQIFRRWL